MRERSRRRLVLSAEKLEAYSHMTPRERWREVELLLELGWQTLQALPVPERQRRLEILRAQHQSSDRALLAGLRRIL